jgi:hypothetical protein
MLRYNIPADQSETGAASLQWKHPTLKQREHKKLWQTQTFLEKTI